MLPAPLVVLPRPTAPVPPPARLTPHDLVLALFAPLALLVALLLPHAVHRVDAARLPVLRRVPRSGRLALGGTLLGGGGERSARLGLGGGARGRRRERLEARVAAADVEDEGL